MALRVYERFLRPAGEKGLRLELSLPEEALPRYQWDGSRIEQALSVLLDNALSYTPAGGNIELILERQPGGRAKFTVRDSGPGVPDSEKEHIFERFYRADSARRDREHFGLGLCVAKEIATLHKGRLRERASLFIAVLRRLQRFRMTTESPFFFLTTNSSRPAICMAGFQVTESSEEAW